MKFDRSDLYLIDPRVERVCKRCGTRKPVRGNMYVLESEREKAADGGWSYRLLWLCRNGHAKMNIWTKPVAFAQEGNQG